MAAITVLSTLCCRLQARWAQAHKAHNFTSLNLIMYLETLPTDGININGLLPIFNAINVEGEGAGVGAVHSKPRDQGVLRTPADFSPSENG